MKGLTFRTAAAADVETAHRWYDEQRPGLGESFLQEVQACVERILESPKSYVARSRQVRRAPLHRFPHALFYRETPQAIIVVACFHARQRPSRLWRRR